MKKKMLLTLASMCILSNLLTVASITAEEVSNETSVAENNEAQQVDEVQFLTVVHPSEPGVIDPARFGNMSTRAMLNYTLEMLVRIENGVATPAGAEKWEISEDGKTYTYTLRENYWSDGKRVVAQDYVDAIKRQVEPENAFELATDYYSIKNFQAIFEGEMDIEELGVRAVDDNTLEIELEELSPVFINTEIFPTRLDLVEEYGDSFGTEADKTPSCGPFVLADWVHDSSLKLEKNTEYWNQENIYMQTVNLQLIPDSNAELASFENGSIDFVDVYDPDYIDKFSQNEAMDSIELPSARTNMIIFNTQDEVFKNEKIRLAFSLALDRETLVEILSGGLGAGAYGLSPTATTVGSLKYRDYAPEPLLEMQEKYPDPVKLLVEGMKEEGLGENPEDLTVSLAIGGTTAESRSTVELYQQMFQEALGCNVEVSTLESNIHFANMEEGKFQMGLMSWGSDIEPNFQLTRWVGDGTNYSHWKNQEYEDLVNKALTTLDENERLDYYYQAEKLLIQTAAIAPTYFSASKTFYYNYVNGFPTNPFDTATYSPYYTSGRE